MNYYLLFTRMCSSQLILLTSVARECRKARRLAAQQDLVRSPSHGQQRPIACTLGNAWPHPRARRAAPARPPLL